MAFFVGLFGLFWGYLGQFWNFFDIRNCHFLLFLIESCSKIVVLGVLFLSHCSMKCLMLECQIFNCDLCSILIPDFLQKKGLAHSVGTSQPFFLEYLIDFWAPFFLALLIPHHPSLQGDCKACCRICI